MEDFLKNLLENIFPNDFEYEIKKEENNGETLFTIVTPEANAGQVIGKWGKVINSLRTLLKVRATVEQSIVNLQVETK